MFRTTRDMAKLVIADEGLAPGKEINEFGKELLKQNTLFASRPPINELLIDGLKSIKLEWMMKDALYVIEIEKSI